MTLGAGGTLTAIVPDPRIIGHAFLSCTAVLLRAPQPRPAAGSSSFAALVLDAKRPGSPPASLPGMRALRSHPGLYAISNGPAIARPPRSRRALAAARCRAPKPTSIFANGRCR